MGELTPTTLEEIEALEEDFLVPTDIAAYMHVNPESIRKAADKGKLPWAFKAESRTVISKRAFVHWCKYGSVITTP